MSRNNLGADIVANAILGKEARTVLVAGKPYFIKPPTIKKIAGAGRILGSFSSECNTIQEVIDNMADAESAARALSWFIAGDESLTNDLCEGTLTEVTEGLSAAVSLLGIQDFLRLSDLSRSVRHLIANPK